MDLAVRSCRSARPCPCGQPSPPRPAACPCRLRGRSHRRAPSTAMTTGRGSRVCPSAKPASESRSSSAPSLRSRALAWVILPIVEFVVPESGLNRGGRFSLAQIGRFEQVRSFKQRCTRTYAAYENREDCYCNPRDRALVRTAVSPRRLSVDQGLPPLLTQNSTLFGRAISSSRAPRGTCASHLAHSAARSIFGADCVCR